MQFQILIIKDNLLLQVWENICLACMFIFKKSVRFSISLYEQNKSNIYHQHSSC